MPFLLVATFKMLDGHSAVLWQAAIYIWGGKEEAAGRGGTHYSNSMYVINPSECIAQPTAAIERMNLLATATGESTVTSTIPRGRAYHCASMYGKLMLVTGGLTEVEDPNEANNATIPVFDMERRVWITKTTFGDVPCPRCHHVTVVYGDTLMLHGGYPVLADRNREVTAEEMSTMQHAMYDVHELNMATMRWRRIQHAQSPALWGHSAVLYNRNVIVFGGVDVIDNCESGAVAVWHTEKKQWRWADFKNLELRCAMHTAVQDGGRMIVFSGVSFRTHTKLRTLYEFNLDFGSWRELHPKGAQPLGRIGHSAVAYNQCVFIIGGSVEVPNSPSIMAGKAERAVHVYNITLNDWHTCALVAAATQSAQPVTSGHEKSWSAGNLDPNIAQAAQDEWSHAASQVKETIARAKAIQSLADTALTTVAASPGADPRVVPFDDSRRAHSSPRREKSAPRDGAPMDRGQGSATSGIDARQVVNTEEAKRVIDYLQQENERLRSQLEDFRSSSVSASGVKNPYEVPVFNSKATVTLPPNEGIPSAKLSREKITEFVPRLNLNVADPPRVIGGETGYMSRTAVSALVQSSLNKDVSASSTMAIPPANMRLTSLDPMSFLSTTSNTAGVGVNPAAQWHPNNYAPPQSYDQLLARAHATPLQNSSVPLALQPLITLFGGVGAQFAGVSAQSAQQQGYPQAPFPQQPAPAPGQPMQQMAVSTPPPGDMGVGAAASVPRQSRTPSLSKVVSGQASMLSLSHMSPRIRR